MSKSRFRKSGNVNCNLNRHYRYIITILYNVLDESLGYLVV